MWAMLLGTGEETKKQMITFNWSYKVSSGFYILTFTFHPNEKPSDNVWKKNGGNTVSWAPTHSEQGQIAELLGLANCINGLPIHKREKLRTIIDRDAKEDFILKLTEDNIDQVVTAFKRIEGLYME